MAADERECNRRAALSVHTKMAGERMAIGTATGGVLGAKECTQNPRKSFEGEHMTSGTRTGGVFVCRKMHENPVVCRICAWPVVFHPDNPPRVTGWG